MPTFFDGVMLEARSFKDVKIDPQVLKDLEWCQVGTPFGDLILGTSGDDCINGLGGNDSLRGEAGDDTLKGAAGDDDLQGGLGDDSLMGGTGNDMLNGGMDADTLIGGDGDDVYIIADVFPADTQEGDTEELENFPRTSGRQTGPWQRSEVDIEPTKDDLPAYDEIIEELDGGTDTVRFHVFYGEYFLPSHVENVELYDKASSATGNELHNRMTGNNRANELRGGDGADTLIGAGGADALWGGIDNDVFRFEDPAHSTLYARDTIKDFESADAEQEDVIHLSFLSAGEKQRVQLTPVDADTTRLTVHQSDFVLLIDHDGGGGPTMDDVLVG